MTIIITELTYNNEGDHLSELYSARHMLTCTETLYFLIICQGVKCVCVMVAF